MDKEYFLFIKNAIVSLAKVSEKEAQKRMNMQGFVKNNKAMPRMRDSYEAFGFTQEMWDIYRKDNFFFPKEKINTVDESLIFQIHEKFGTSIVTTEVYDNLIIKAKQYKIDLENFDEIYSSDMDSMDIDKFTTYQQLISKYDSPNQVLVIGDRYHVDLVPMIKLNGNAVLVKNVKQLNKLLKKLLR